MLVAKKSGQCKFYSVFTSETLDSTISLSVGHTFVGEISTETTSQS